MIGCVTLEISLSSLRFPISTSSWSSTPNPFCYLYNVSISVCQLTIEEPCSNHSDKYPINLIRVRILYNPWPNDFTPILVNCHSQKSFLAHQPIRKSLFAWCFLILCNTRTSLLLVPRCAGGIEGTGTDVRFFRKSRFTN